MSEELKKFKSSVSEFLDLCKQESAISAELSKVRKEKNKLYPYITKTMNINNYHHLNDKSKNSKLEYENVEKPGTLTQKKILEGCIEYFNGDAEEAGKLYKKILNKRGTRKVETLKMLDYNPEE
jgi:hypothetical protein